MPESVFTQTMPLLLAGGVCWLAAGLLVEAGAVDAAGAAGAGLFAAGGAGAVGAAGFAAGAGAVEAVDALVLAVSEEDLDREDFLAAVAEAESVLASGLLEVVESLEVPELAAVVSEELLFLDLEDFLVVEELEVSEEFCEEEDFVELAVLSSVFFLAFLDLVVELVSD